MQLGPNNLSTDLEVVPCDFYSDNFFTQLNRVKILVSTMIPTLIEIRVFIPECLIFKQELGWMIYSRNRGLGTIYNKFEYVPDFNLETIKEEINHAITGIKDDNYSSR